jgi:hypothetical protein
MFNALPKKLYSNIYQCLPTVRNYYSIYLVSVDIASDQSLKVEIGKRKNSAENHDPTLFFTSDQ